MTELEYQSQLWWKQSHVEIRNGHKVQIFLQRTRRGIAQFKRNAMKSSPHLFTTEALHRSGLTKRGQPMRRSKCGNCFHCNPHYLA